MSHSAGGSGGWRASGSPTWCSRVVPLIVVAMLATLDRDALAESEPLPVVADSLKADPQTGALYILTSDSGVWEVQPNEPETFRRLATLSGITVGNPSRLSLVEGQAAFCPLTLGGKSWVAALSIRPMGVSSTWLITTVLAPLEKTDTAASFRKVLRFTRFGRLMDVAFDPGRERLLLTDPDREGIYEIKLSENGLSELVLALSNRFVRAVTKIVILPDRLFAIEEQREAVLAIDLATEEVISLVEHLPKLEHLAVHPGGSRLVVSGGTQSVGLHQIDPISSLVEVIDTGDARLGRITGIAVDARDHLWIAGQSGKTLFEFGPGTSPGLEHFWEWQQRGRPQ